MGKTKPSIMQNDPYVNEQQQSINSSIFGAVLFIRADAYWDNLMFSMLIINLCRKSS